MRVFRAVFFTTLAMILLLAAIALYFIFRSHGEGWTLTRYEPATGYDFERAGQTVTVGCLYNAPRFISNPQMGLTLDLRRMEPTPVFRLDNSKCQELLTYMGKHVQLTQDGDKLIFARGRHELGLLILSAGQPETEKGVLQ